MQLAAITIPPAPARATTYSSPQEALYAGARLAWQASGRVRVDVDQLRVARGSGVAALDAARQAVQLLHDMGASAPALAVSEAERGVRSLEGGLARCDAWLAHPDPDDYLPVLRANLAWAGASRALDSALGALVGAGQLTRARG